MSEQTQTRKLASATAFPLLLSEITEAKREDNDYSVTQAGLKFSNVSFYGLVGDIYAGEPKTEGDGWLRPPSFTVHDEDDKTISVSPKPWDNKNIELIQSLLRDNIVHIVGKMSWYKSVKYNEMRNKIELISLTSIPDDRLLDYRRLWLIKLLKNRIGDKLPYNSFLFNEIVQREGIPFQRDGDFFKVTIVQNVARPPEAVVVEPPPQEEVVRLPSRHPSPTPTPAAPNPTSPAPSVVTKATAAAVKKTSTPKKSTQAVNNTPSVASAQPSPAPVVQSSPMVKIDEKDLIAFLKQQQEKITVDEAASSLQTSVSNVWDLALKISKKDKKFLYEYNTEKDVSVIFYKKD